MTGENHVVLTLSFMFSGTTTWLDHVVWSFHTVFIFFIMLVWLTVTAVMSSDKIKPAIFTKNKYEHYIQLSIIKHSYSQWQNIMGILKIMFKNPPLSLYNVANP